MMEFKPTCKMCGEKHYPGDGCDGAGRRARRNPNHSIAEPEFAGAVTPPVTKAVDVTPPVTESVTPAVTRPTRVTKAVTSSADRIRELEAEVALLKRLLAEANGGGKAAMTAAERQRRRRAKAKGGDT